MFERYTEGARRTIFFSRYEASQLYAHYIAPERLLLGLLREARMMMTHFLSGNREEEIRRRIEQEAPRSGEKVATSVDMPLDSASKRALAYAAEEADRNKDAQIAADTALRIVPGRKRAARSARDQLFDGTAHRLLIDGRASDGSRWRRKQFGRRRAASRLGGVLFGLRCGLGSEPRA